LVAGSADNAGFVTLGSGASVQTRAEGAVSLVARGENAWLRIDSGVTAGRGGIELAATSSVGKLDAALLDSAGDIVIRAADGLKIVDANGQSTSGTYRRGGSTGVLRIEGNQTIESDQRLLLRLNGPTLNDQLVVSGTLLIRNGATVDIARASQFVPELGQHSDIVRAGTLTGQFTESTGLYGFGDGARLLMVQAQLGSLALDTVKRPLADLLDITVHSQVDADKLGSFFNADYFGVQRNYDVGMTLQAADFLTVDGRFVLSNADAKVALADGTEAQTRRWVLGGANLNAFVGLNGPYRQDADHDGILDADVSKYNATAAGFELTGVDIGLALHVETQGTGGRSAPRGWLSLKATAQTATEVGLPFMTLEASAMSIQINAGTAGDNVIGLKEAAAIFVPTGEADQKIKLDFDPARGIQVRAAADFTLNVASFITASGSMGFERSLRDVVLADGTKAKTEVLAFGGQNLHAFVGLNGPSDGKYTASQYPDAIGLALTDVDFAFAVFSPRAGQSAVAGLTWTALRASAGAVEIVGLPDITIAARNLSLDLNLVDVSGFQGVIDADSKVIDFAGGEDRRLDVLVGTNRTQSIRLDGRLGQYV
jgi:hypothetical protein